LEGFVPNLADRLRAVWARRSGGPAAAPDDLARRVEQLERLVRVSDAAARTEPPPPGASPRRNGPSWLDLFGVLTLLGLLVYGAVAFSYVTFFTAFDVTLEEVGLGYATLLRRSGLNLAVVVASLALAAAIASFFGDRTADHRTGAYAIAAVLLLVMGVAGMVWLLAGFGATDEAGIYFQGCWIMAVLLGMRAALGPMSPSPGWPRAAREAWRAMWRPPATTAARRARRVGLLVIAAAVLLVLPLLALLWSSQDLGSPWPGIAIVAIGMVVIVWGPAGLHRARRTLLPPPVPAALPVVALLVIAIALAGAAHGQQAAATVKRLGDLRRQGPLGRAVLDVSTPRVCVAWVGAVPAPAALPLRQELLYLGQADSILALYDVSMSRPIRVSSQNVVLIELSAAERAARTPQACPSGARRAAVAGDR
jgi:MFS family permease